MSTYDRESEPARCSPGAGQATARGQARADGTGRGRGTKVRTRLPRHPAFTAKTADKHALYEASVQDTDVDITFIDRVYRRHTGQLPRRLREDFCGTGKLCASWVARGEDRHAVGLDLHRPTLRWGQRMHVAPMGAAGARVALTHGDVLAGHPGAFDVVVAFNFSYCCLTTRPQMLRYLRRVRAGLAPGGAFFMDIHGGTEVFEEMEETTRHKGFTYVWDQGPYDPITGHAKRHIHFRFPDGTSLEPAFSYSWRLWHLPEVADMMAEAGFGHVDVFWEGADGKGAGDGIFKRRRHAENELSWVAYMVAVA